MARLPDEVIQKIKAEVSLLRLVESQGYQLQQQGKDYALCCPFHEDKEPSCIITPKSNLFNCFGCGAGGSVIDWVMKIQGVSFRHAVEILREDAGTSSSVVDAVIKKATVPKLDAPISEGVDDQTVLQEVMAYYHQTLKQSPEALEYLERRGLNDPALIDHFKLGYANRTLGLRLPQKNRKAGAALRTQLQAVGLYRDTGREHFAGSLVIPVMSKEGRYAGVSGGNTPATNNNDVKEVYGRKLLDNLRKGTPKHTYLPGPHTGIFNVEGFTNTGVAPGVVPPATLEHPCSSEVILCESLIDALTFWRWGFKHVTTSYGANGFTDELLQAFKANHIKRVLIAYDRDEAGNNAAEKLAKQLNHEGIDCYRVLFPKGMDANEYALKMQPPGKSLELVLRKAEFMGKGTPTVNTKQTADGLQPTEKTADGPPLTVEKKKEKKKENQKTTELSSLAAEPLPASPMPEQKPVDIEAEVNDNEVVLRFGKRRYRVRGLNKSTSYEQLKINLAVSEDENLHVDQLDLYNAKQRHSFVKQASVELGVTDDTIKKDLAKVLLKLEQLQDDNLQKAVVPKNKAVELTNEEQQEALRLLKDKDLLNRILEDFNRAGVVGEETNKLVGYLAAVSRKLDNPLAVIIQSTSAAGKSSLMNAVLAMMPEEERIQYSAMTGQSLFYMGETNLKHKILAIAEEEGAEQASYALKLLQSEGELTIASTGKDADGNLTTQEYRVEGPVMLFSTTTAIDIDEELMNRCLVLTVNESREQTQLIHQMQRRRRTLAGLEDKTDKKRILTVHRNAQRLLRSLHIVNPYADQLTFLDDKTRTRRDHEKYLSLIDTITLLHQHQRAIKQTTFNGEALDYIEVTLNDIDIANRLAHDVLGRTLSELPPQTLILLKTITHMVTETCKADGIKQQDYRFSRRDIRDYSGWSDNQLKVHCRRLEELEYLLVHRGSRGKSIDYELLFVGDIEQDRPQLIGLIDIEQLKPCNYDDEKLGQETEKLAPSCPQVGAKLASSWGEKNNGKSQGVRASTKSATVNNKTPSSDKNKTPHRNVMPSSLAARA